MEVGLVVFTSSIFFVMWKFLHSLVVGRMLPHFHVDKHDFNAPQLYRVEISSCLSLWVTKNSFQLKLILLFRSVPDNKKIQKNKAVKFSFSDTSSRRRQQRFLKANEIRAFHFRDTCQSNEPVQLFTWNVFLFLRSKRYNNYLISLFSSIYGARASRLGHKSRGRDSVRNLQYGPRTRLRRVTNLSKFHFHNIALHTAFIWHIFW